MKRKNEAPINPDFKNKYRRAFSQISPSEAAEERIVAMTDKKCGKSVRKVAAMMAAVIALLICVTLVAEAATSGAVSRGISQAAANAVNKVTKEIWVIENGNKVKRKADIQKQTDADGTESFVFTIGDDEKGVEYRIVSDGEDDLSEAYYIVEYEYSE